jgi:hypothetical protein
MPGFALAVEWLRAWNIRFFNAEQDSGLTDGRQIVSFRLRADVKNTGAIFVVAIVGELASYGCHQAIFHRRESR